MRFSEIIKEQAEEPMPHLYLDMDGVQCDFFTAWAKWHARKFKQSHIERYKEIGDEKAREQSIHELNNEGPEFIEQFFAELEELPNFHTILGWIKSNKIPFTILSAPLRGNNAASIQGKLAWLDQHNPGTSSSAIFRGDKERLAMRGGHANVLVDDHKVNISRWEAAGGMGVLYRDGNPESAIAQLEKIYAPYLNK